MLSEQPALKPGDFICLQPQAGGEIKMAHVEFLHNGRIVLGYGRRTDHPEARIHSTKTLPEVTPFVCDIWRVTSHSIKSYTLVQFDGQELHVPIEEPVWTMVWSRRFGNEPDSTNQG